MFKTILMIMFLAVSTYAENIVVEGAASLKYVLEELKNEFLKKPENKDNTLEVYYNSSGKAYSRIMNGFPTNLFLSADESYPQKLFEAKKGEKPEPYAVGKLVVATTDKTLNLDSLESVKKLLETTKNIAVANPKLAPYGVAGVDFLKKLGIYENVKNNIVLGESINQTTQYIKTGSSKIGLTALSMVVNDNDVNYFVIDQSYYNSIKQSLILINYKTDSKLARDFAAFVLSDEAKDILEKYGYGQVSQ